MEKLSIDELIIMTSPIKVSWLKLYDKSLIKVIAFEMSKNYCFCSFSQYIENNIRKKKNLIYDKAYKSLWAEVCDSLFELLFLKNDK